MAIQHHRLVLLTYHADRMAPIPGAGTLGMVGFVLTDALFLIAGAGVYLAEQQRHGTVFAEAADHLAVWPLVIALAMLVLAVWSLLRAKPGRALLLALLLLAAMFTPVLLAYQNHWLPVTGRPFAYPGADPVTAWGFFRFYTGFMLFLAAHWLVGLLMLITVCLPPRRPGAPLPLWFWLYWGYLVFATLLVHALFYHSI